MENPATVIVKYAKMHKYYHIMKKLMWKKENSRLLRSTHTLVSFRFSLLEDIQKLLQKEAEQ